MTGNLDRYGEPLEDQADTSHLIPPRTRDQIHRDRCAELRRILRDARARREAKP